MSKYFESMFQDLTKKELTDCTFVFKENGEKKTLAAHKTYLACVSPVFKTMFFGSLTEESEVLVEDISFKTFEQLLTCLYTEKLEFADADEACDFYYAAKKYDIPNAVNKARSYMNNNMNASNSKIYFGTVRLFEDAELLQKCTEEFAEDIYNTTKAPNFFKDTEPLELNDKIKFNSYGKIGASGLQASIKKLKSDIFKVESIEDMINECLTLIRTLVLETKDVFKMIISETTAQFDTSLNLVPINSTFFNFNKVCSSKIRNYHCSFNCYCCVNEGRCQIVPDSTSAVRSVLQKYTNKDLSTFWFEDVQTIFKQYQNRAGISKIFS